MVKSTSKDTAKKIDAIERNAIKQIKQLKEVSRLQLQITTIQLNKELWDATKNYQINNEQVEDLDGRNASFYVMAYGNEALERKEIKISFLNETSILNKRKLSKSFYLS